MSTGKEKAPPQNVPEIAKRKEEIKTLLPALRAQAALLVGNEEEKVNELVQDTIVLALVKAPNDSSKQNVEKELIGIMKQQHAKLKKKGGRNSSIPDSSRFPAQPEPQPGFKDRFQSSIPADLAGAHMFLLTRNAESTLISIMAKHQGTEDDKFHHGHMFLRAIHGTKLRMSDEEILTTMAMSREEASRLINRARKIVSKR